MATLVAPPALADSAVGLLHQLIARLEQMLGSHKSRVASAAELARTSTALQQLQHWLPSSHDLQLALVKLHKLLPALLQPQAPATTVRLLAAVYQIQQSLLGSVPVELTAFRASARVTAQAPLGQLWSWQQAAANTETADFMQPLLAALLQQLVAVARRPAPAAREIADSLWSLHALLEFGHREPPVAMASELLQALSMVILHPGLFSYQQQVHCWQQLWQLLQQQQAPQSPELACHDLELLQTVQLELGRYRRQLLMFLQQAEAAPAPVLLSYPLLLLHYRLPWLLLAAGQRSLSWLCQLWHQCLMVHWYHRVPVGRRLLRMWHDFAAALDLSQWPGSSARQITRGHLQLLQQWPASPARLVDRVAFQGVCEGEQNEEAIPLAGIPERLSRAFVMLSEQVVPEWFADSHSYAQHAPALTTELLLLEQGAAAVKLPVIERFCSLLLALHQQAATQPPPAGLLWRAHLHLRDLLDEAAAWQEAVPDKPLADSIRQWLQTAAPPLPPTMPATAALAGMLARLHDFVNLLAGFVEQPLRFNVELASALPEPQLPLCEETLIALLRFVVLEQVQSRAQRRQALKPLATTLVVKLAHSEAGITVVITETGVETAPDAPTLKRLRHKLPDAVQQLECRTQPGRGRSFHLVI